MSRAPEVTVLMPVFNGARYLRDALESVRRQSFRDFELLVIDDGSTDETPEILRRWPDPRLRVERQERNLGLARTRNHGVALARGEYVALLDADDRATPGRLAAQVCFLRRHREMALVGSWVREIDEAGRPTGSVWRCETRPDRIPPSLLFWNAFAQSAVTARRCILERFPYREALPPSEDYDLWARIAAAHPVANLPRPLVSYRRHAGGASQRAHERVERNIRRIQAEQLARLGLAVADAEMDLHRALTGDAPLPPEQLEAAGDWLWWLWQANRERGVYRDEALAAVLAGVWYAACSRAAVRNGVAWEVFRRAPIRMVADPPLFRQARLWLKSRFLGRAEAGCASPS